MFAILIITFTLRCFSTYEDIAETPELLTKTVGFLLPKEMVRLQQTNAPAQSHLDDSLWLNQLAITAVGPAVPSTGNTAKLWNAQTGELIASFEFQNDRILTKPGNTARLWGGAQAGELIHSFQRQVQ